MNIEEMREAWRDALNTAPQFYSTNFIAKIHVWYHEMNDLYGVDNEV